MNKDQVTSLLRQVLAFGGGFLVAKGWIDNTTMLELVAGAASLGGVVWAMITHAGATKSDALAVATGTGTIAQVVKVETTTGKPVVQ